ncbi:sulfurtransferase complex subunit TusC [Pseudomonas tolaasii]|uniref:sulfurtransferase complex subunit TusC n=1 Tax=Pseudomonas tolaasii TaxID=29442 RepID=UPI0002E7F53E|nr:sulfurtransferase complex subunit TusC [Pseudomonas tolaasii]MBW1249380.1 sulfurtransferase complex subunit TusC [Pseudomonas tolaasii]MBW4793772.1 sulfurtransferase complex subunit TusC [Pseudomonas tolaasii]NVZ45061.1 sulfurtransferase complex subunit TusC [Pseudomonas tolaasii]NWA47922.1 sulfurtransferase complex subunit TusC [Pseudomonas tolaasii]NWC29081.1 sulfurtransferase complex subunit TusC [Pseudomonas tolaasii]
MAKSLLIISRQAPWSGPGAREALDIVLAGGAFDLPIGLLFMDDGVFQLAANQAPKALQQKDLSANLQALELFGVEDVFACRHSLDERGLVTPASAQPLNSEDIATLIDRYDQVVTL